MFVVEDPGGLLTAEERRLRAFQIRSCSAHVGHRTRGRNIKYRRAAYASKSSPKSIKSPHCDVSRRSALSTRASSETEDSPASSSTSSGNSIATQRTEISLSPLSFSSALRLVSSGETFEEGRSVQFFVERTSSEWSGWCDDYFWRVIATQASTNHSCIRHGLISLAAAHEALEIPDLESSLRQKQWALQQGRISLSSMAKQHSELSLSSLLVSHLIIMALTFFLDDTLTFSAMKALYDLDDQLTLQMIEAPASISKSDQYIIKHYVHPIVERQKAKLGHLLDMLALLQVTPAAQFDLADEINIPEAFSTLEAAREKLDQLLNWTTYLVKTQNLPPHTVPIEAELKLRGWDAALATYQTISLDPSSEKRSTCNKALLQLSAQVYLMLIKLMHSDSEMDFDRYTDIYRNILIVYRLVESYKKTFGRTLYSSGLESSMLTFIGNAACRWCRDPLLRQALIIALKDSQAREGHESSLMWASAAERIREIEERPSSPQADEVGIALPSEAARIRIDSIDFYMRSKTVAIRYRKYPYREGSIDQNVTYITHPGCGSFKTWSVDLERPLVNPDMCMGPGWTTWLVDDATNVGSISRASNSTSHAILAGNDSLSRSDGEHDSVSANRRIAVLVSPNVPGANLLVDVDRSGGSESHVKTKNYITRQSLDEESVRWGGEHNLPGGGDQRVVWQSSLLGTRIITIEMNLEVAYNPLSAINSVTLKLLREQHGRETNGATVQT